MVTCISRLHYPASEPETPTKQDDTIRFRCNGIRLKSEVLSKFFAEDFKKVKQLKTPIDPRSSFVNCWSKIFLAACLVSMFVDPLFLYMPMVQPVDRLCLENSVSLGRFLTSIRSMTDLFFVAKVLVRFRTAYVAPSSCVFGAGDLVVDPWKIALRYITTKGFWFDITAAIPIPQAFNSSLSLPSTIMCLTTSENFSCWPIVGPSRTHWLHILHELIGKNPFIGPILELSSS